MSGYLSESAIQSCILYIAGTYPSLAQARVLPETSVEGRTIRSLKIGNGSGSDRHGVLFIGGVHARELINPDLLVTLALKICQAYSTNTGLTFGGKSYAASTIKLIVDALDLYFLPLVNPDGRAYVQSPTGDAWWRKNRSLNPGLPCRGVDLNRNFDFLWSSGIGTSASSCSDIYKGSAPFSEPETRNVRSMFDSFPHIHCFVDVHSYSELVLYPWGDDDNQIANPTMNFQNAAYNGVRGTPGDSAYREYMVSSELDWFTKTAIRVRDTIAAVRGRTYTAEQSIGLYPTTATSDDYAYARHLTDSSKNKVRGFTIETAREFQPTYSEALQVMDEASAGLIEFCLACICAPTESARGTSMTRDLDAMRAFRTLAVAKTALGRRYVSLLEQHGGEIASILFEDDDLMARARELLRTGTGLAGTARSKRPKVISEEFVKKAGSVLGELKKCGSTTLKEAVAELQEDLPHFRGKGLIQALEAAAKARGKR